MATLEASLKLRDQFTAVLQKVDNSMQKAAKTMQDFKQKVAGPAQALNRLGMAAQASVAKLNSSIRSGMSSAANVVKSLTERILSLFGNFGNRISERMGSIGSKIADGFNRITGRTKKIQALDALDKQLNQLNNKKAKIQVNVDQLPKVQSNIENINRRIERLNNAKADIKANVKNADVAEKRLTTLDQHIQKLNNKKAVLQVEASKLDRAKSHIADVQKQIDALNQKKIELNTSAFSRFSSKVSSVFSSVGSQVNAFKSKISSGFSSVANVVKSSMSRVSSFVKQSGGAFKQYGNDLKSGFSGISESGQKATGTVRNFVAALGLMKIAGAAINTVRNSLDGAIDRFDTLNQFPRMMQAVGFSAEQAAASKDKLVAGIDGLPTTLGEVVSTTQRIATMTKDLDGATSTTLALNNALLASGADTDKIARGTEQYLKILTTGKVEMDSFTTLQETMGVALNDVANSFGFAGDSAQNDLYKALQKGDIPVKAFNNRLIEMSEAAGGFAERALIGSEGIKTSFKNIKTAVTNGVETSIRKMDELSQSMTGKSIAQHLNGFKGVVKDVFASLNSQFDKVPGLIQKITPYFNVLKEAFNDVKGPISDAVNAVKESLSELTGSFGSAQSVDGFRGFVSGITDAIKGLANFVRDNSDSIAKLISMLPKLAAAFVGFKIGKGVLSPLLTFGKGIGTVLGATGKLGGNLAKAFGGLFGFGKGKSVTGDADKTFAPLTSMTSVLTGFAKKAASLALIFGVIKLIEEAAQALKDINDKVPDDLSKLGPKLANMGIALTGMGAFVAVAGKLAQKNPVAAVAGLASVAAISLELMLAAEAMQQVNAKVPDDIGNFASKVANIAIAIGGMSVLVGAVGAFVSTGAGAIVGAAGLLAVAAVAGELMLVSEAIQQMDAKVPDDLSSVKSKIDNIAQVIGYFTAADLGSVFDIFSNLVGGLNTAVVTSGLKKFEDLASGFESFMQIEVPSGIETKITEIQKVIEAFGKTTFEQLLTDIITAADLVVVDEALNEMISVSRALGKLEAIELDKGTIEDNVGKIKEAISFLADGDSLISKIKNVFSNGLDTGVFATANMAFNELVLIGYSLKGLEGINFNYDTVEGIVEDITEIIGILGGSSLRDVFDKMLKTAELSQVKEALAAMTELQGSLDGIQGMTVNPTNTIIRIQGIQEILGSLDGGDIRTIIGTMLKKAELTEVKDALEAMIELGEPINALGKQTISSGMATNNVRLISSVIEELGTADLLKYFGTMLKTAQLGEVKETLAAIDALIEPINSFASKTVSSGMATNNVRLIGTVIQALGTGDLKQYLGTMLNSEDLGKIRESLVALQNLVEPLNAFATSTVSSGMAINNINLIGTVIAAMSTDTLGTAINQLVQQVTLARVLETLSQLSAVRDAFNTFAATPIDVGAITTAISNVKSVITQLNDFPEVTGVVGMQMLANTFNNLAQQLSTFVSAAEISIGGLANVSAAFETTMTTMQTSVDTTMAAIQTSATAGMAGFNAAIAAGVALAASTAASGKAQILAAFNGMGPMLYSAGVFAMSGLARGITAGAASAISAAQSVANRVTSTIQNALKIASPSRVMIGVGRFVSEGLAKGITSAENLVAKASNSLATLAVPNQLAAVSASGTLTSNVHLDDSEVSKMQASASQTVIVQHKQVVPQVTVNVENNGSEPVDPEVIAAAVEQILIDAIDSDLG